MGWISLGTSKGNEETKVLILSARSQIADKVDGLDDGGK